jgi:hypothetical protein
LSELHLISLNFLLLVLTLHVMSCEKLVMLPWKIAPISCIHSLEIMKNKGHFRGSVSTICIFFWLIS